ncbi:conserved hypothetical protein [Trichinella spiralis]|uniref:hypothetical protein n=1 Tax=Trichinella spiralis TaxID=6334 RepID=UPI0001EFCDE0|nr:conserved hypothetical protein [Trichinella spiralis]
MPTPFACIYTKTVLKDDRFSQNLEDEFSKICHYVLLRKLHCCFIHNKLNARCSKEGEQWRILFCLNYGINDFASLASRIEFLKEMWKKESDAFGKVAVLPQGTEAQKKAQQKAAMEAIQKNLQDLKKVGAAYTNDNLSVLF